MKVKRESSSSVRNQKTASQCKKGYGNDYATIGDFCRCDARPVRLRCGELGKRRLPPLSGGRKGTRSRGQFPGQDREKSRASLTRTSSTRNARSGNTSTGTATPVATIIVSRITRARWRPVLRFAKCPSRRSRYAKFRFAPSRSSCRRPATNTLARTISASRMSSTGPATTAAIRGTASGGRMAASRRPRRRTGPARTSAAWAATAWLATRRVAGDGNKRRDCGSPNKFEAKQKKPSPLAGRGFGRFLPSLERVS